MGNKLVGWFGEILGVGVSKLFGCCFFMFLSSSSLAIENKIIGFELSPGMVNLSLTQNHVDLSNLYGQVTDNNGNYLGVYLSPLLTNPYSDSDKQKIIKLKNYLLYIAVNSSINVLREESDSNIKVIKLTREDVKKAIEFMDIAAWINDGISGAKTLDVTSLAKFVVDSAIKATKLECKNKRTNFCDTINNDSFDYIFSGIKDILFVVVKDLVDEAVSKGVEKVAIDIVIKKFVDGIFDAITIGYKIGDILNNLISASAINKDTQARVDVASMLSEFLSVYLYYDQDITKIKDIVEVVSKREKYNIMINKGGLNNFLDIFGNYISLVRNTSFGCKSTNYINYKDYTVLPRGECMSLISKISMVYTPSAADIMLRNIEQYGNGGMLEMIVNPEIKTNKKSYKISFYPQPKSLLYFTPNPDFRDYDKAYYGSLGSELLNFNKEKAKCKANYLSESPKIYIVNNIKKSLAKVAVDISCSVNYSNYDTRVSSYNGSIFIDEIFPDVSDYSQYYLKYLGEMVNNKSISYIDKNSKMNNFKPNDFITIGEMFKIIINTFNIKTSGFYEDISVPFMKYANSFTDSNINIYLDNKNDNIEKDRIEGLEAVKGALKSGLPAKREYVAKVLFNTINSGNKGIDSCVLFDNNKWPECARKLTDLCIVKSEKNYNSVPSTPESIKGSFRPNDNMTRAEFIKVVSLARHHQSLSKYTKSSYPLCKP